MTLLLFLFIYAQDLPEGWVGKESCMECHEDEVLDIEDHLHTALIKSANKEEASCESCHGPGEEHADDPDLSNILDMVEDRKALANNCMSCHKTHQLNKGKASSAHASNQVDCLDCHGSSHTKTPALPMLKTKANDLCSSCHQDQMSQFKLPFSHREGNDPMACISCHNLHDNPVMKPLTMNDKGNCLECHTEKQGPFVFAHPPKPTEGCSTCHATHGSQNPFILKRAQANQLCLECHTDTPSFHDLTQPRFRACSDCHTAVHGSHRDRLLIQE